MDSPERLRRRFRILDIQESCRDAKNYFVTTQRFEEAAAWRDLERKAAIVLECYDNDSIDEYQKYMRLDRNMYTMFFTPDELKVYIKVDKSIQQIYLFILRSLKLKKLNI